MTTELAPHMKPDVDYKHREWIVAYESNTNRRARRASLMNIRRQERTAQRKERRDAKRRDNQSG
jgi:hypothetical protein